MPEELALAALAHHDRAVRELAARYILIRQELEAERLRRRRLAVALLDRACQLEVILEGPEDVLEGLLAERGRRRRLFR